MINQNYYVHETAIVDDSVLIGDNTKIWHYSHVQFGAVIGESCSIGQNVKISNNVHIGHHATIGAGAVVASNVPPHALMLGVPAKQVGWVCECGQVLISDNSYFYSCPDCGREYVVVDGELISASATINNLIISYNNYAWFPKMSINSVGCTLQQA